MGTAPKDRPILGWCRDECGSDVCAYYTGTGTSLCLYHGHAEGLSHVEDGPHVLVWGGSWDDSSFEYAGGWMPDWWFRSDSEFEVAANPIAWAPIPDFQHAPETTQVI